MAKKHALNKKSVARPKAGAKKSSARRLRTKDTLTTNANAVIKDAGAWALMGYFYQLVVSAGHKLELLPNRNNSTDLSDTLLRVEIETIGQDIVATSEKETQLVQIKYSQDASRIPPSELADILRTLQASEDMLTDKSKKVNWLLKSNRELSDASLALVKRTSEFKPLKTNAADARIIRKVGSRMQHELYHFCDFEKALADRAKTFGVRDVSAVPARVSGYLLRLIHLPPGQRIISLKDLDAELAGFARPRSLRAQDVKAAAKDEIERFAKLLGGTPLTDIEPRDDIEKLIANRGIGIALVLGHGGCGKTRGVLRSLYDLADRQTCVIVTLLPGPNPTVESFSDVIARWRSEENVGVESFSDSLARLRIANEGNARPIIVVALDGIDEAGVPDVHRRRLSELLLHFYEGARDYEPEGLLIVTCRVKKTFYRYVAPEGTGDFEPLTINSVELGDFSPQELVTVWNKWFNGEAPPRFAVEELQPQSTGETRQRLSSAEVRAKALLHPALLGCVRNWKPAERAKLLAGNDDQWLQLLDLYLNWFANKVERRDEGSDESVLDVLKAAAHACVADIDLSGTYDQERHWTAPALSATRLVRAQANRIFSEAISCGLIISPDHPPYVTPEFKPSRWRWRFEFLKEYFSTKP